MLDALAAKPIYKTAYRAQQKALLWQCLAAQRLLRSFSPATPDAHTESQKEAFQYRYRELLRRDLQNVADGLYPRELLFQFPTNAYLRQLPRLAREIPRVFQRMKRGTYQDLPQTAGIEEYPAYFRRNFHWQSDGYFSADSARIYDVSVEFLFLGTADVMRRQVIPPITRFIRQHEGKSLRLLDFGCGTGRTLSQISKTHPTLKLYGLDLSPYYLKLASENLRDHLHASFVEGNAEHMPFKDAYLDMCASVYLFHELPASARRNVLSEALRVLKPGGLLVVEDSAQFSESPDISEFLDSFAVDFHEPYYRHYLRDDLGQLVTEAGFELLAVERHFLSKVVVAKKP